MAASRATAAACRSSRRCSRTRPRTGAAAKESRGRERRAFVQRLELGPDHVLGDPFPPDERAEPAVDAGHYSRRVADRSRYGLEALRDDLGVLDEVALRIDYAGDQGEVLGQRAIRDCGNLVLPTRVREL